MLKLTSAVFVATLFVGFTIVPLAAQQPSQSMQKENKMSDGMMKDNKMSDGMMKDNKMADNKMSKKRHRKHKKHAKNEMNGQMQSHKN